MNAILALFLNLKKLSCKISHMKNRSEGTNLVKTGALHYCNYFALIVSRKIFGCYWEQEELKEASK